MFEQKSYPTRVGFSATASYPQAGFRRFVEREVINYNSAFCRKFGSKIPGLRIAANVRGNAKKTKQMMLRKTIFIGVLILLTVLLLVDFYRQNESRKLDQTFNYLKANKSDLDKDFSNLKSVIKKTNEFKAEYFSQLTSKVLSARHFNVIDYLKPKKLPKDKLISLLSDTTNFSVGKTTFDEVDYVVRFYDSENRLIMKIWIGLECKMLDSEPEMTNNKAGYLSEKGLNKFKKLLEE